MPSRRLLIALNLGDAYVVYEGVSVITSNYEDIVRKHHDRVPEAFDQWVRAFGIETEIAPICYTVTTWVKHCSIPDATPEQLTLACMDLAVSFFYLDDYQDDDYPKVFDEFESNLNGEKPITQRRVALAHADLLQRFRALGGPTEDFLRGRKKLIDEYRLRNRVMRGEALVSFSRYMECRLVTIYVYQWIELWLLLGGFQMAPEERSNQALADSIRLATTFYFFGNDLYSFNRDALSGEPNLVCLLRDEQGISLEEAAAKIDQMRVDAHRGFMAASEELLGARSTAQLRRCGQLLRLLVGNATVSRHDNPDRYVKPDSLFASDGTKIAI